jgi:RNA polymerase sigma-70 factor, ECF subfamily
MSMLKLLAITFAAGILEVVIRAAGDAGLIHRLQSRDPKAMSDLYDRYGRLVYSLIYRIVRNPSLAEDLVQETFLRIWNRVGSFDAEKGAIGAWVLTVARNRAIDHVRSMDGRMQAGVIEMDRLENTSLFASMDMDALSLDRMRRLKSAFEKLTPNQRQVIDLAYYEGLSQTEMAERLNQPLGTVKTWTRSALKILRDELAGVAIA